MADLPGVDLAALTALARRRAPGLRARASSPATVIAGGKSNLTYRITDGTSDLGAAPPAAGARAADRARHGPRVTG